MTHKHRLEICGRKNHFDEGKKIAILCFLLSLCFATTILMTRQNSPNLRRVWSTKIFKIPISLHWWLPLLKGHEMEDNRDVDKRLDMRHASNKKMSWRWFECIWSLCNAFRWPIDNNTVFSPSSQVQYQFTESREMTGIDNIGGTWTFDRLRLLVHPPTFLHALISCIRLVGTIAPFEWSRNLEGSRSELHLAVASHDVKLQKTTLGRTYSRRSGSVRWLVIHHLVEVLSPFHLWCMSALGLI